MFIYKFFICLLILTFGVDLAYYFTDDRPIPVSTQISTLIIAILLLWERMMLALRVEHELKKYLEENK